MATAGPASLLMAEECFSAEDPRFVSELLKITEPKKLAPFVERWKKDPREWARAQIFEYLKQPLNTVGHQVVVKRLFKHAEARKDDTLMAAFMAAFDTLVRHTLRKRYIWNFDLRTSIETDELHARRDGMKGGVEPRKYTDWRGKEHVLPVHYPKNARLFTYHTRYYLCRRAWRYFRRMAFMKPDAYVEAVSAALLLYKDEHVAKGENLLDCWSLLHACFGKHEALMFTSARAKLREGRALGELSPAPFKRELWQKESALKPLLNLVQNANARIVRLWAMQMVRSDQKANLASISIETLGVLLNSADNDVQTFAAELLQNASNLDKLTLAQWLKLLETQNLTALNLVCESLLKHVTHERVDLAQSVDLACARQSPIARLGLNFLKQKTIASAADRAALARLGSCACEALSGDIAAWALGVLGKPDAYDRAHVLRFFDSIHEPARTAAWNWLTDANTVRHADTDTPAFWACLVETPFDDLKFKVFDVLRKRTDAGGVAADPLTTLWSSILLNVHRGGRYKSAAIREIAAAIRRDAALTELLLPVLAVALRSVRLPERRAALASIVTLAEENAEIAKRVGTVFPELKIDVPEGVR